MTRYLRAGAAAGGVGGLALALVLRLLGEGPINDAIAIEHARQGGVAHEEMFSRATQQVGGMVGAALAGIALGAIFAVTFAAVRHRLAGGDDWRRAVNLAAVAFATLFLVPFLKYPANPPAVGDPATVGRRTALYLVMVAWSVLATWAAWRAHRWLRAQGRPDHLRVPATALLYAALVAFAFLAVPAGPDPVTAPATLVWHFRIDSLAGSAIYWSVTGCVFGWLRLRAEARPATARIWSSGSLRSR